MKLRKGKILTDIFEMTMRDSSSKTTPMADRINTFQASQRRGR